MFEYLKAKTPPPLKRAARRAILDPIRHTLDGWRLGAALDALRRAKSPGHELVASLREAWGNGAFSADVSYIMQMARLAERTRGPILECGSGLTTLIAGILAERRGQSVLSLEQDPEWLEVVQRAIDRYQVAGITVVHTPLRQFGDHVWYDLGDLELPRHTGAVLCDGPFVDDQWGPLQSQWRYGLLPALAARSVSFDAILLDDATERFAAGVAERWTTEFDLD